MALSPKIELKTSQHLAMTPQLQQAIKLLQMSNVELAEFLTTEIDRNPFLELAKVDLGAGETGKIERQRFETLFRNTSNLDLSQADNIIQPETLADHLTLQVQVMGLAPQIADLACIIINELGDDGYLRIPLVEISNRCGVALELTERALSAVQSCSPTGVAARSFAECLRLQLLERGVLDGPMQVILDNTKLLAKNATRELVRLTGCTQDELKSRLKVIRTLNPKPGSQFLTQASLTKIPDIVVTPAVHRVWSIELTTNVVPQIIVNNRYVVELNKNGVELPKPMLDLVQQAHWLVRTLDRRATTILKVATAIVRLQDAFFRTGISNLLPMTLKSVAAELGVHESTISRVVTGKYIACDRGVFALKELFSRKVAARDGAADRSAASVKSRISHIIMDERFDRRLTDGSIVTLLNDEGIQIARRTVAKYRAELRLPVSGQRRIRAN